MELTRITAPDEPVITLEEARDHLRVDPEGSPPAHPDDALIEAYVQAASDELDGPEAWLGRALVTQTWAMTLAAFPADGILLPLTSPKPVASPPADVVQSITYVDTDGVTQTLAASAYRVISEADPIRIERAFGTVWPSTRAQADAVRVVYKAGYGAAEDVPEIIKSYIRLRVGQYYENREATILGISVGVNPFMRDNLESIRQRGIIMRARKS